jgi:hypothetical protein
MAAHRRPQNAPNRRLFLVNTVVLLSDSLMDSQL